MRAADTNVIVRLFVGDDEKQTAAAEQFVRGGVWLGIPALLEMAWVLSTLYDFRSSRIADTIDLLLKNPNVLVQHSEAVQAAVELYRNRPNLGFTDCLILEVAREAGHLPLGTFDRRLASVTGAQRIR